MKPGDLIQYMDKGAVAVCLFQHLYNESKEAKNQPTSAIIEDRLSILYLHIMESYADVNNDFLEAYFSTCRNT